MKSLAFNLELGILKALANYFEHNEWFLGGSRRFGYSNKDSDMDIFVHVLNNTQQEKLWKDLNVSGFTVDFDTSNDYGNTVHAYKDLIHIVSIRNKRAYLESEAEHNAVFNFIEKNPVLKYVARSMRQRLSGAQVYRALLAAMKQQRKDEDGTR